MNTTDHQRALDLITESPIEGISAPDAAWLQSHLASCAGCAEYATLLGLTQQAMAAIPVTASPELVTATQARVRIRALEMRERSLRVALLSVSAVLCVATSLATLAYLRAALLWVQAQLHMPAFLVQASLIVSWFLPATIIALALLLAPHRTWHPGRLVAPAREET